MKNNSIELIENLNEFRREGKKCPYDLNTCDNSGYCTRDFNAFIVITNNQYIMAYTPNHGLTSHFYGESEIFNQIMNLNIDFTNEPQYKKLRDLSHYSGICSRNFICARMFYDKVKNIHDGSSEETINIHFMPPTTISPEEYECFKKFAETFDSEIQELNNPKDKYNAIYPPIELSIYDQKNSITKIVPSLTSMLPILNAIVDPQKEVLEEENLVGVSKDKTKSK